MTQKHQRHPIYLYNSYGNIGKPPSSARIGYPAWKSHQYLKNWLSQGQLFSYSAAQFGDGDGKTIDGTFYVIFHNAPKDDSTQRMLGGKLIPWTYEAGAVDDPVTVTWTLGLTGGSEYTLVSTLGEMSGNPTWQTGWELAGDATNFFYYNPDASGLWTAGRLKTHNLRTAALGLWTLPDSTLTDDQALAKIDTVAPGDYLKGFVQNNDALGMLIHRAYYDTANGWDDDTIERNATRCLFQWGHPCGLWHDDASYCEPGVVGTTYKLSVPKFYTYASNRLSVYPTVIASATNASAPDPAYIKISSITAGDSWELPIINDAVTLYDYTDASNDKLSVRTDEAENIKIEIKAPSAGEVVIHTIALWAHAFN